MCRIKIVKRAKQYNKYKINNNLLNKLKNKISIKQSIKCNNLINLRKAVIKYSGNNNHMVIFNNQLLLKTFKNMLKHCHDNLMQSQKLSKSILDSKSHNDNTKSHQYNSLKPMYEKRFHIQWLIDKNKEQTSRFDSYYLKNQKYIRNSEFNTRNI